MDIGGVTSQLVSLALDAANAQHRMISQNIANANSAGYTRGYVDFGELFDSVARGQKSGLSADAIVDAKQRLEGGMITRYTTIQVSLEQEMAELAKNTLYFQTLLTGLGKRGDVLKMAISEGK